jgi:hypothetical protein
LQSGDTDKQMEEGNLKAEFEIGVGGFAMNGMFAALTR